MLTTLDMCGSFRVIPCALAEIGQRTSYLEIARWSLTPAPPFLDSIGVLSLRRRLVCSPCVHHRR